MFIRGRRAIKEQGSPPVRDIRPPDAVLYSDYIKARPPEPVRGGGSRAANAMIAAAEARTGLDEAVRNRLLLAMKDCSPCLVRGVYDRQGRPTDEGIGAMVDVVAERLARAWGELALRAPSRQAWDVLVEVVVYEDRQPRVLDVVGAWLDAYARIPDQPWLQESEARYMARVDEALAPTTYARRGRDLVLRRDAGSAPVVERPLRAFMTDNPQFAHVDHKLGEALAELDAGNGADAITDAATALQLLLKDLGYDGKTLGEQVTKARNNGLFTGVDHRLGDALLALANWVAAIRNQRGDAHPGPAPDPADAQLLVRMVALLVMRLGR